MTSAVTEKPPLTSTQTKVLQYILEHQEEHGVPPTLKGICEQFGWSSLTAPRCHLEALRKKGYIEWNPRTSRHLRLLTKLETRSTRLPLFDDLPPRAPAQVRPLSDEFLVVDTGMFMDFERRYALRVKADTMVGAGIHPGDIVFVQREPHPAPGRIIVAWHNGLPTLKRLQVLDHRILLCPENPVHAITEVVSGDDFFIEGFVTGFMRLSV